MQDTTTRAVYRIALDPGACRSAKTLLLERVDALEGVRATTLTADSRLVVVADEHADLYDELLAAVVRSASSTWPPCRSTRRLCPPRQRARARRRRPPRPGSRRPPISVTKAVWNHVLSQASAFRARRCSSLLLIPGIAQRETHETRRTQVSNGGGKPRRVRVAAGRLGARGCVHLGGRSHVARGGASQGAMG
jgi:hypothetical protein